jgi:hypothetical protein
MVLRTRDNSCTMGNAFILVSNPRKMNKIPPKADVSSSYFTYNTLWDHARGLRFPPSNMPMFHRSRLSSAALTRLLPVQRFERCSKHGGVELCIKKRQMSTSASLHEQAVVSQPSMKETVCCIDLMVSLSCVPYEAQKNPCVGRCGAGTGASKDSAV